MAHWSAHIRQSGRLLPAHQAILRRLQNGPATIGDLSTATYYTEYSVRCAIADLRAMGLISPRRQGTKPWIWSAA
jgi:predicted transcriptional regulator